jgi:hypothetical protein
MHTMLSKLPSSLSFKRVSLLIFVAIFLVAGTLLLMSTHAATGGVLVLSQRGALTGPASLVSDPGASNGQAVRFGSFSKPSAFVAAAGTSLILNGQPFRFIGFNPTGMTGICIGSGSNWTVAQMDAYFSNLPANGMSRVFAVQTVPANYVLSIVTEAAKYDQRLIMVLGDDISYCKDTDGAPGGEGSGKTAAYYQSGWKGNYLKWISQIVPLLANSTTVGMWEIANEPFLKGATLSQIGLPAAQAYINGAAAAIRAADPNHLVTIGTSSVSSFGGASTYQTLFSVLDILDFHDYSWVSENGAVVASDFALVKTAAQNLHKPFMVDEAGAAGGSGCTTSTPNPNTFDSASNVAGLTLAGRVSYLVTGKANTYLGSGTSGGAAGIVFWDYALAGQTDGPCSLEMQPNDPMVSAVKNYVLPN